jgi:hypothetical protein
MKSSPRFTRRALARFAAVPLVWSAKMPAQTPPGPTRGPFQSAAQQMAGVKLPRNIEPASRFEA